MANVLDASNALRYPGQEYPFVMDAYIEDMEFSGDPIHFDGVTVEGLIVGAGEKVSVRADVRAALQSRCVRCLDDVTLGIHTALEAVFARKSDPDDPDLYIFEASALDITDAVRDALIMELPMTILCKRDCKGLCPVCGANRNLISCTCREVGEVANPFEALKEIVHNDEEV